MFSKWFMLTLFLLLPMTRAQAFCGNSCWESSNNSSQSVLLSCDGYYSTPFYRVQLSSHQSSQQQYDRGWGDGMGFPVPNALMTCQALFADGPKANFQFKTLDWGDHVQFEFMDHKVVLTLRDSWSPHRTLRSEFEAR